MRNIDEDHLLTIRTRSSKNFGSIGDDAADLISSLFKPCQIPKRVFLIDFPCRVGEELGDRWWWWWGLGTDKYSFDVSDMDDVTVGLLLLSNVNCKWLGREELFSSIVIIGDDCVATSRRILAGITSERREKWVDVDERL